MKGQISTNLMQREIHCGITELYRSAVIFALLLQLFSRIASQDHHRRAIRYHNLNIRFSFLILQAYNRCLSIKESFSLTGKL